MPQQDARIAFRNPVNREGLAQVNHVLTLDKSVSDGAFRHYTLLLRYARQKSKCWLVGGCLAQDLRESTPASDLHLAEADEHALTAQHQRNSSESVATCEVEEHRKSEDASAVHTSAFEVRVLRARATLHAATIAAKEPHVKRAPDSDLVTAPAYSSLPEEEPIVLPRSSHSTLTTSWRAMNGTGGRS